MLDDGRRDDRRPSRLRSPGVEDLGAWLAGLAADHAAQDRAQAAWLQRQAAEEGTFAGVMADLGERSTPMVLHLSNGRRHRGSVVFVGSDACAVRASVGTTVLIRFSGIASVRTLPDARGTLGDRPIPSATTFAEALTVLAEGRTRLQVWGTDAASGISGDVRTIGRDFLTLMTPGGGLAYVALASAVEVSLAESG